MKKLFLITTLVLLTVLAFGLLGTGAWFTDSATLAGNRVSTGNLDLGVTWNGAWSVTKIEPGADYRLLGYFCAINAGDYDMKWRGMLRNITDEKGLRWYLVVRATANPSDLPADLLPNGNHGPDNTIVFTDVPFHTLTGWNAYIQDAHPSYPFNPGEKICEKVEVKLLSSAPNSVQAATLTADLYLDATQYISDAWSFMPPPSP